MATAQVAGSNLRHIAQVLAGDMLVAVRDATIIGRLVSTDFKNEVTQSGKTIDVLTPKKRSASTKTIGTAQTPTVASTAYQQISLDTHIYDSFHIEDVEQAWASGELSTKYLPESAYAMAEEVDEAIVTAAVAAFPNFDSGVATAATFDKTDMITCSRKLKQLNASTNPANLIGVLGPYSVSHAYEDNLTMVGANTLGEGGDNLKMATLGRGALHGISWYWSNNITTGTQASPAVTYEKNLIFDRSAIQLVHRPLPPASAGAISAVATDPNLGLSIRVTVTYDGLEMGHLFTTDMLYGIKVMNRAGVDSPVSYLGGVFRSSIA